MIFCKSIKFLVLSVPFKNLQQDNLIYFYNDLIKSAKYAKCIENEKKKNVAAALTPLVLECNSLQYIATSASWRNAICCVQSRDDKVTVERWESWEKKESNWKCFCCCCCLQSPIKLKMHVYSTSQKEPSNLPIHKIFFLVLHVCKHTSAAKVVAFKFEAFFQCAHSLCKAAAKKKKKWKKKSTCNCKAQLQLIYGSNSKRAAYEQVYMEVLCVESCCNLSFCQHWKFYCTIQMQRWRFLNCITI